MFRIIKRINKSATYGINGIMATFREEFMMRVQFCFGLIQFILSLILGFALIQVVVVFIIWIILISQENMNTAIENLTDLVIDQKQHNLAKRAKDSAGGAVLIVSIMSWIVFIVFLVQNLFF